MFAASIAPVFPRPHPFPVAAQHAEVAAGRFCACCCMLRIAHSRIYCVHGTVQYVVRMIHFLLILPRYCCAPRFRIDSATHTKKKPASDEITTSFAPTVHHPTQESNGLVAIAYAIHLYLYYPNLSSNFEAWLTFHNRRRLRDAQARTETPRRLALVNFRRTCPGHPSGRVLVGSAILRFCFSK
jgi:hypothetical protein